MGITPQPNVWQCGPFALKHALITLGIFADEATITRIAGTSVDNGTDEKQLALAARHYHCDLPMIRRHRAEKARSDLLSYLRRGIPALLCLYKWSHWVAIVKAERGQFIVLDSEVKAVLTILSWGELKSRWVYHLKDEYDRDHRDPVFDLHPVIPRKRVPTKARFSVARARYLRRPEHRSLTHLWDQYLVDLMAIAKPRTSLSVHVISLGEFFRRHDKMILDQVDYWHGDIDRVMAARVLQDLHFVADTYGLVIHEEDEKRAIAGITSLLTLWAAGRFGSSAVYEDPGT